jgi:hypothetical protein
MAMRLMHTSPVRLALALSILGASVQGALAQPPVTLVGQDANGTPYPLEADRGKVVAVVTLSRYTSKEAAPVQDAIGAAAQQGKVVSISVIDLIGVPRLFQGIARRKVREGGRTSPLVFLVDDQGLWRHAFGVQPDKRVDILVLDRQGVLRGHFVGREQLGEALRLVQALRDSS